MECEVVIPYGSDGNLGAAYNRTMERAKDWVCFFDHDVLQVNPNWYSMILKAIEMTGRGAGFITATCNAIACREQLRVDAPRGHNTADHMGFAKKCQEKYGALPVQIDPRKMQIPFSGFMILTHKGAWRAAGGFKDGFLGVDNWYHMAIAEKGYTSWLIPGLYMYHIYSAKQKWSLTFDIEGLFATLVKEPSDINEHLPILKRYAAQCDHVTEFGFRSGVSTVALLAGNPKRLVTYDINPACKEIHRRLCQYDIKTAFDFALEDTTLAEIEPTDFLFIDSAHNYAQCKAELAKSAGKVKKFIGFHDTVSFGLKDESAGGPGLLQAIDEFIQTAPWRIKESFENNNGLIILERTGQ